MQVKKITAGIAAVTIALGVFSGCGDVGSKAGSKPKATPKEAFEAQVDMLNNTDLKDKGAAAFKVSYDAHDTDTRITWDNLTEGLNSKGMDFTAAGSFEWNGDKVSADIDFADSKLVSFAFDGNDYFVDLSAGKTILEKMGVWDESMSDRSQGFSVEDILSTIKIPKASLDSLTQQAEQSTGANVDTEKLKSGFTDAEIAELKKLAEKAEYDGDKIVIKGLKDEDLKGLKDAFAAQAKEVSGDESFDLESKLGVKDMGEKDVTIDYALSYSEDKLDQTHTFVVTNKDGDTVTFEISMRKPDGDIDFSKFSSAKTIEEITNNQLSFDTLLQYVMMGVMSSSTTTME